VLAVVAGFAIGGSGSKSKGSAATLPQSASASAVQLSFPAGWKRVAGAPAIRGLDFTDPLVLEGGAAAPGRLTAGEVDATGATLLPAALHAGRGQAVSLGGLQALRYRAVRAPGSSTPMTVYAVPTTSGVATIACSPGATGAAAFLRTCDQVAGTLRLIGVKAYPLGPSSAHARALTRELSALKTRRAGAERALAAAGTPKAQAAAAATLAGYYRTASRRLDRLAVTPYAKAAHGRVVFALRSIGDAYAAAASAARSGDGAAYARARTDVRHGGQALGRALAALKALGYTVSA
jgi:hypothetical protein